MKYHFRKMTSAGKWELKPFLTGLLAGIVSFLILTCIIAGLIHKQYMTDGAYTAGRYLIPGISAFIGILAAGLLSRQKRLQNEVFTYLSFMLLFVLTRMLVPGRGGKGILTGFAVITGGLLCAEIQRLFKRRDKY